MRRLFLLTIASLLSSGVSLFAAASIGSTAREFRTELGRPSCEEHLVRTATLRWKPLRSSEPSLTAAKASALSVSLLDGHASEVTIWCERRLSNADTARLAQRFL